MSVLVKNMKLPKLRLGGHYSEIFSINGSIIVNPMTRSTLSAEIDHHMEEFDMFTVDNTELISRLRAAAKRWREENSVVGVGELRYDMALLEAADVLERMQ